MKTYFPSQNIDLASAIGNYMQLYLVSELNIAGSILNLPGRANYIFVSMYRIASLQSSLKSVNFYILHGFMVVRESNFFPIQL